MTHLTQKPDLTRPDEKTIQSLFDAIPSQYDFLNSFFSLGLEKWWRRRLVSWALSYFPPPRGGEEEKSPLHILDLGVGTGKSLAGFLTAHSFRLAVGCDFSRKMLQKAKERLGRSAFLVSCDFHELPFPARSFDLVTGSFMLRSVQNMKSFLLEVKRVLAPGGRAAFLELTRPSNRFIWRFCYQPYLQFYIPCVGQLFSRHDRAYQFLSQSIQSFAQPSDLKREFESAGFSKILLRPLTFGAATLIQAHLGGANEKRV